MDITQTKQALERQHVAASVKAAGSEKVWTDVSEINNKTFDMKEGAKRSITPLLEWFCATGNHSSNPPWWQPDDQGLSFWKESKLNVFRVCFNIYLNWEMRYFLFFMTFFHLLSDISWVTPFCCHSTDLSWPPSLSQTSFLFSPHPKWKLFKLYLKPLNNPLQLRLKLAVSIIPLIKCSG